MGERDHAADATRSDSKKPAPSILRFAGMGTQLAVAIGLGVVAGHEA